MSQQASNWTEHTLDLILTGSFPIRHNSGFIRYFYQCVLALIISLPPYCLNSSTSEYLTSRGDIESAGRVLRYVDLTGVLGIDIRNRRILNISYYHRISVRV